MSNEERALPRTIVTDVAFGESIRWHEGRVWFCDWIGHEVISVAPDGGDRTVHVRLEASPICIDWRTDGSLLIVEGAAHRLVEHDGSGELNPVADLSEISDRTWNEVVAHPSGRVYVNGIGYDMMAGESPTSGQIAVVEPDGSARQVAEGLEFPNGMAISPDGRSLVVAESHAGRLSVFTIAEDGALDDRQTFANIEGSAPDGICMAPDGSVWYADVPNQCCRRVAEAGAVLDTIEVDRGCFSCALSPDGTLFIVAADFDETTFTVSNGVVLASST